MLAAAIGCAAPVCAAPLESAVSVEGGPVLVGRGGVVRDDTLLSLRLGVGLGRRVALQLGLDADVERLELGARLGAMVRPWLGRIASPYARAEVALVGKTYLGHDWELRGGVGLWLRLQRWVAAFFEVDVVGMVSAPRSLGDHVLVGAALTAPSFWR
jgi:hypothetical protein